MMKRYLPEFVVTAMIILFVAACVTLFVRQHRNTSTFINACTSMHGTAIKVDRKYICVGPDGKYWGQQ